MTVSLLGQNISAGVKGGFRLTGDLEGDAVSESQHYLVGPALELHLPLRLAFEVDTLYSRFGLRTVNADSLGSNYTQSWRANSWEFPLLVKFRPLRNTFVEAGYVPRTMNGSGHFEDVVVDFQGNRTRQSGPVKTSFNVSHGLIAGGGLEFGLGHLRLTPEVRYTGWNNRPVDLYGSHGYFVQSTQNRTDVLIGIWCK